MPLAAKNISAGAKPRAELVYRRTLALAGAVSRCLGSALLSPALSCCPALRTQRHGALTLPVAFDATVEAVTRRVRAVGAGGSRAHAELHGGRTATGRAIVGAIIIGRGGSGEVIEVATWRVLGLGSEDPDTIAQQVAFRLGGVVPHLVHGSGIPVDGHALKDSIGQSKADGVLDHEVIEGVAQLGRLGEEPCEERGNCLAVALREINCLLVNLAVERGVVEAGHYDLFESVPFTHAVVDQPLVIFNTEGRPPRKTVADAEPVGSEGDFLAGGKVRVRLKYHIERHRPGVDILACPVLRDVSVPGLRNLVV